MKPIVIMFSGQGSQFFHMGKELYIKQPVFKKWMDIQDNLIANLMGESIVEKLYDEKNKIGDDFNSLRYSHPAIFMVQYALYRVLTELKLKPYAIMGASLGEFTAAAATGVLNLEDGLELVVKQAEIIEKVCSKEKGGMLTILDTLDLYDNNPLLFNHTELAGINYNNHFVISGTDKALNNIENFLVQKDISFQRLPVSFAFHSQLIEKAKPIYKKLLQEKKYNSPAYTFLSCMTGGELNRFPKDYFWQIIRKPMVFPQLLENLEKNHSYIYLDLSPSGTLANFVKNNLKEASASTYFTFMSPFGSDVNRLEKFMAIYSTNKPIQSIKKEKTTMKVFMFPGQGAQQKGMGENLFKEFSQLTESANKILGYSIEELCLEDPDNQLSQTQFTQPAIYVVNALSYLKKIQEEPKPSFVLGHSVAEYNALYASGVVDFETGLKLVKKRGELMALASGGGMAAVLGISHDKVEDIIKENNFNHIYIANHNSSYQIVISGLKEDIEKAEAAFLEGGATHYKILKVSGAFHTPYMEDAAKKFKKFVKKFKFGKITIPVISNVTARPYKQEQIKDNIIEQITHPVKWMESIQYLLAKNSNIDDFHEISGIGLSVVKALVIRINNEAGPLDLSNEEPQKNLKDQKTGNAEVEKTLKTLKTKKEQLLEPPSTKKSVLATTQAKKGNRQITIDSLGSPNFKKEYGLRYAYLAGGMYRGIASKELVIKMGKAGMMGFFGTGGLEIEEIENAIQAIQSELKNGEPYGMNLVSNPLNPENEEKIIDLFLKYNIHTIEAAAFLTATPSLVKFRAKGLDKGSSNKIIKKHHIIAKISRPEVAEQFLSPAPERIINNLLKNNKITEAEASLLKNLPIADDICVEADSGGHTDQGMPYALMPAMLKLRDQVKEKYNYSNPINVGAAGGIGTPEAAAAAFILGADFILTGSINQCSVEAGTSDAVKDLLQHINVQDTDYAPAGDMFELGAKIQVLKRGVFFPARANKLYELYRHYDSLDSIDEKSKKQLQERYFKRTFNEIYDDVKSFYPLQEIEKAEQNPKYKMALVFRWYFGHCTRLALSGDETDKVNYHIPCGPSLGAFNQWVKGTKLEDWRNRHVDEIGKMMMEETAGILNQRFQNFFN